MVKGSRTPAVCVTTSEPRSGNAPPGAPVTASMSGFLLKEGNQGGTVEYCMLLYPTPDLSGGGLFYTLPENE